MIGKHPIIHRPQRSQEKIIGMCTLSLIRRHLENDKKNVDLTVQGTRSMNDFVFTMPFDLIGTRILLLLFSSQLSTFSPSMITASSSSFTLLNRALSPFSFLTLFDNDGGSFLSYVPSPYLLSDATLSN